MKLDCPKLPQSMPQDQAKKIAFKAMRRILCQFPVNVNTGDYFDSIFEQVCLANLDLGLFNAACIRLAGQMLPYKPPMAAEYLQAARRVKADGNQCLQECEKCLGLGLYLVKVFDRHVEKMVDAYTPCRECIRS